MELKKIFKTQYSQLMIAKKRGSIRQRFIDASDHIIDQDIKRLEAEDLYRLVVIYDELFLGNVLKLDSSIKFTFDLSKTLDRVGGLTQIYMKQIKSPSKKVIKSIQSIKISINTSMVYDFQFTDEARYSCGIQVKNSLEVLMIIIEHELCHVLEFLMYKKSDDNGRVFKQLTLNLFGHTSQTHSLMTNQEKQIRLYKVMPGDDVKFILNGRAVNGLVERCNLKDALVLVFDSKGKFILESNGKRYTKYKIPIGSLLKVTKRKRERIDFRL